MKLRILLSVSFAVVSIHSAAQDVVAPNSNLVLSGIPEISTDLARDVGRYSNYRSASFSGWLPGDDGILISTRFGNASQIHRVAAPGATREQLTFFKEPVRGASVRPERGDSFVFVRDTGGDEFYQIYLFDMSTGDTTLLSDGKKRNSSPLWNHDGSRVVYARVDANDDGAFTELHLADLHDATKSRKLITLDGGGWGPVDFSHDGKRLSLREHISVNKSNIWILDIESGEKTPLLVSKADELVASRGGLFSSAGENVYITTDKFSEFRQAGAIGRDSEPAVMYSDQIPWDVTQMDLSPDGETLALLTNEAGIGVLHLVDVTNATIQKLEGLPVGTIAGIRWHPTIPVIGFSLRSAKTPGDAYSVNAETGAVTRWTYSETGPVDTDSFREPELVSWTSFDGLEITGFLYRPPAKFTGKRPVLMQIHGGPEGQSRPGYLGSNNYFVQELGMAVLYPNVRGSAGFGKTFLRLDNGFKREDSYKDINALLDWIEDEPTLDEDNVIVRGGSYGGFMTLAVSAFYSDRIKASVDIVGISNLRTFLENTQGYRRDLRRVEYGDERDPKMRAFLDRTAPLTNAHLIKKPMLVIQGANDPRVPKSESDQIVETLRINETPVWYLVAMDEGHGFRKKANSDFAFFTTAKFIKENIEK